MIRGGRTPRCRFAPISCCNFITSRATRRLDRVDPDLSRIGVIDNLSDCLFHGGLLFFRVESLAFGVSGAFGEVDLGNAYGANERLPVDAFYESVEFLYRLLKMLAGC